MSLKFESQAGTEDAMVAALVQLHRQRQRAQQVQGAGQGAYARVLRHFEQRGERLRGERLMTAELLGRLVGASRALPPEEAQQELTIVGPAGGVAAGRFRVVNRSAHRARMELVAGEPLENTGNGAAFRPTVTFEPARVELEPGEGRLVRVVAELSGDSAPATCEVAVECRGGGRRDRLWLRITVEAPHEAPNEGHA